jgi:iron complex outermembrane recepter protein
MSTLTRYIFFTILFFLFGKNVEAQHIIQGMVMDAISKEPMVSATVYAKGTTIGTVTDAQGKFFLKIPNDVTNIVISYTGYSSRDLAVDISTTEIVAELKEGVELENIVVIGSRNQTRTKLETPVPVDVIPIAQVINEVGQVDINQILTYLAPSFQSSRQTISDGTDHIDPASLRGLGPDQVLVLVNGKRRHQSSLVNVNGTVNRGTVGTDMSAIPPNSIERIEILRDGAAAQYGSDAIAGVINIVLKQETGTLQAATMSGIHKAGDGQLYQASVNYGFKLAEKGFVNVTGEFSDRGFTNRMKAWEGPVYATPSGSSTTAIDPLKSQQMLYNTALAPKSTKTYQALDDSIFAAKGTTRSTYNMRIGNSAMSSSGIMFNAAYPLSSNGAEIYSFGGYNFKKGNAAGFYRMPTAGTNVPSIYPNGFLPEINTTIQDKAITVGVRGQIKGWSLDLSNNMGRNSLGYRVDNSLNTSAGAATPTSFNCGGFGYSQNIMNFDASKLYKVFERTNIAFGGEFRSERYEIFAGEEASYKNYGLKSQVVIDTLIGKNAAGNVTKTPYFANKTVDILGKAGGAQVFPGFRPENITDQTRTASSAYLDVETDFSKDFMVGVAMRFEDYSDFGRTLNYKIASRYKLGKAFSVRAATSTGFRAPSQQQKYFSATSTLFQDGVPVEVGTFPNNSRAAELLGIPKLKQETNVNYSAGFTARPIENMEITVDAYRIDINNRIILTGQFGNQSDPLLDATQKDKQKAISGELLAANVQRAAFFTNAVSTRTQGIDIVIAYNMKFTETKYLRLVAAGNLAQNKVKTDRDGNVILNTTSKLQGLEAIYFNREDQSRLEVGNPRGKANLTIQYVHERFNIMLRNAYWDRTVYLHPEDGVATRWVVNAFTGQRETRDQTFTPRVITDLTLGYQLNKNLNISVGANNLLDIYPDKHTHSANYDYGRFVYSRRVTQFGFNGAFYFARLRYNLK